MTIERSTITGAYQCSDIIGGYLVRQTYYGYTKRQAMQAFRHWCKGGAK
jgi:hypothetical protein